MLDPLNVCSSSYHGSVILDAAGRVLIAGEDEWNSAVVNAYGSTPVGMYDHAEKDALCILGNPVQDQLIIVGVDPQAKGSFQIFDMAGRCVLSGRSTSVVDVSGLPVGHYTIRLGQRSQPVTFIKM